ncbi:MAG: 2-dehydropantoate 2-reductase, partial [bacterium]|nr:2-dehydropantoate 2-reductase [bacterium]
MRVVVLGAGALGSVYGAWLADAGADVMLVARRPHAEAVRRDGLEIRSYDAGSTIHHVDATDDPAAAGDADLVLVAAKSFDVPALLAAYGGRCSMAFSVQNGVDQALPLVERFGPAAVEGVSMVG